MRHLIFVIFSLFLTACQVGQKHFQLPKNVQFQGKNYEQVTHNQIDDMQSLLYLPSNSSKNPENWQQGILLFVDKNSQGKNLRDRVALRQKSFNEAEALHQVKIDNNELRSQVIYPPTARFNDVLLEVSRGRDSACGYSQIQFSDKRSISANVSPNLKSYVAEVTALADALNALAWQIPCKK